MPDSIGTGIGVLHTVVDQIKKSCCDRDIEEEETIAQFHDR